MGFSLSSGELQIGLVGPDCLHPSPLPDCWLWDFNSGMGRRDNSPPELAGPARMEDEGLLPL